MLRCMCKYCNQPITQQRRTLTQIMQISPLLKHVLRTVIFTKHAAAIIRKVFFIHFKHFYYIIKSVAWAMHTESGLSRNSLSFVHKLFCAQNFQTPVESAFRGSLSTRTSDSAVRTFWPRANKSLLLYSLICVKIVTNHNV